MDKNFLLPVSLFLLFSFSVSAQKTQQEKVDSVRVLMQQYFNAKDIAGIYSLAGEGFKKSLPTETFKTVCETQLFPLGKLNEALFEKHTNGVNKYKAVFDKATLSLLLSLDKEDKMQLFLFEQYKDPNAKKNYKVPTDNKLLTALDKKVDELIASYMSELSTSGVSIGILKDGKITVYNYGETERENKQLPTAATIYEIGSISKTFTAILLADAVKKGKIKLDDPVNKYLPDSIPQLQYNNKVITVQMLSNHSSAIPYMPDNFNKPGIDAQNPFKDYNNADLFSFLKHLKLTREPGTKYEYSNTAVGLLGVILERVYKKTFEKLIIETICAPLGMKDTRQIVLAKDTPRFAKGYTENGTAIASWDFQSLAAAGCIRSTVNDMMKYLQANINTKNPSLHAAMQLSHKVTSEKDKQKVALGWHILKPGNEEIIFHNGQTGGYHAYMAFNKEKKFGVVILSNCSLSMDDAGNELIKWLEK
jgi:CubicO group peptidase (beta-lactamase class C family)